MDRQEFLRTACGLGACGCALALLGAHGIEAAEPEDAPDQRLDFARYQVANLVRFMAADPSSCAGMLEKTGRECARLGQLPARFKGDPEGYFATARKNWGTEFSWDRARGVVTVAVAEGPCGCPLVDVRRTPAFWCNCSVGYQREAFETIFGRPVRVALRESKLGGSQRCVFEVHLA